VTEYAMLPAGYQLDVAALAGPLLLRGVAADPSLATHRAYWPEPSTLSAERLIAGARQGRIAGRGGAEFPFWRKLQVAVDSGRRRELVVNAAEGEPASAKDSTLLSVAPHLVLDGAQLVAEALGVQLVHVMVPGERPTVVAAAQRALDERAGGRGSLSFELHPTSGGFVGGQARAALELLSGRANLPVTSRRPIAVAGLRGKPTLLSNAETFAQLAALTAIGPLGYAQFGTADEPGTRILSVSADGPGGVVLEVPHGEPLSHVLRLCGYELGHPVLIGGYHGTWLSAEQAAHSAISPAALKAFDARLGAGVILPMMAGDCVLPYTAQIVGYLAQQRAQRCGPCTKGLPALAEACENLARTGPSVDRAALGRVQELCGLVTGRGACRHPDGTARLVSSMLTTFPEEVSAHQQGYCTVVS
jgi:NADH:ubiquinone oxidoreductase subunit F (NADH-binding)